MTGQDYGRMQSCSGAPPLVSSPSSYPLASLPTAGVESAEEKGEKGKKRRQRGGDETRRGAGAESQERDRFTVMGSQLFGARRHSMATGFQMFLSLKPDPCGDPRKYKRDWILSCPSGWRRESCSTSRYCIVRQSRNSGGEGSRYPVMEREVRVLARHPFIQLVPTAPQAHFILFLTMLQGL